jgi:hypothetical protein
MTLWLLNGVASVVNILISHLLACKTTVWLVVSDVSQIDKIFRCPPIPLLIKQSLPRSMNNILNT